MSLLEVSGLSVRYGGADAVEEVSFHAEAGRWLMIVGPNGAGKSTVIRAISRGVPYGGTIRLNGKDIGGIPPIAFAREVGVLSQTHTTGYGFSVEEVVSMGRYAHRQRGFLAAGEKDGEMIEYALRTAGLTALRKKSVLELSGGELQRTFLAQVLAQDPKLVLLDEPVNHLDLIYQKHVMEVMDGWMREKGRAIVSVVHDLSLAMAYGTDALLLHQGRAVDFGEIRRVLSNENLNKVYGMDVSAWNRQLLARWE